MRKHQAFALVMSIGLSLAISPTVQAKTSISKPSAPTVVSITSSTPKKGKVNVTVSITLPTSDGGSKITGSKVTAGGKSCSIKKLKTSCTMKGIKSGKPLNVLASAKNKKGFGSKSPSIYYVSGGSNWIAIPAPTSTPAQTIAPTPTPASTPVPTVSPIQIERNTCTETTSAEDCDINWKVDEDSTFTWSRVCGVRADGGYSPRGGGVNILLTGPAQTCYLTIIATNIATSRVTSRELTITIRGLYPVPVFTITSNTCTEGVTTNTCSIFWSVNEDSEFSWSEVCGVQPDGGGSYRDGGVEIDLSGGPASCDFFVVATSLVTGRTALKDFTITKPMCTYQVSQQQRVSPFGC